MSIPPVTPPVVPMLGRLVRELPVDGFVYEPKWDGFRCLAFCGDGRVDLRSRNDKPLALGADDLRSRPFSERRRALAALLDHAAAPLHLSPSTGDVATARRWLDHHQGGGIDGVVAKRRDLRYEPGVRAMVKVKREQTADCVVAG